mgnify:CR=1 FL=1
MLSYLNYESRSRFAELDYLEKVRLTEIRQELGNKISLFRSSSSWQNFELHQKNKGRKLRVALQRRRYGS